MSLVRRSDVVLRPDPARVLLRPFVPGRDLVLDQESRAGLVLDRLLAMTETDVVAAMTHVMGAYSGRHRDLRTRLEGHYDRIRHRIPDDVVLSAEHRVLIGAYFSNEYSIEGAALCNPSAVPHPDQSELAPDQCRFVLSLRAVGEGHISSIELRTGVFGPGAEIHVDDHAGRIETAEAVASTYGRALLAAQLADAGANAESTRFLLENLPETFDEAALEGAIAALRGQSVTRRGGARTTTLAREAIRSTYEVEFSPDTDISERVLWPVAPDETQGMEDLRLVRIDDVHPPTYRGTYTAFDGDQVTPHLLETSDFRRFKASPLAGPAARNKGLALFPRRVGGKLLALSRWDRETTSLAASADGAWWDDLGPLHSPRQTWELTQVGNCGSPIETDAGWLVFTHGVGPMREYVISALLLDREDPARVIGQLDEPLLSANGDERDGYVPNVVYSCGALLHHGTVLLPYGASDQHVRFATIDLAALVTRLGGR